MKKLFFNKVNLILMISVFLISCGGANSSNNTVVPDDKSNGKPWGDMIWDTDVWD